MKDDLLLFFYVGFWSTILIDESKMNTFKKLSVFLLSLGCLSGFIFSFWVLLWPGDFFYSFPINSFLACSFQIDLLSAYFLAVLLFISFLTVLYSFYYFKDLNKPSKIAFYYFFLGILILSMCLIVLSNDFITFAFMWEVMSISSFFLVMFDYKQKEVQRAGYLYFVFSQFGLLMILFAFGLIYAVTGSFEFQNFSSIADPLRSVIFLIAFVGFGSKAGIFPLHIWLPYAHPVAPGPISALMSGVMIKMGIYGILRMFFLLNIYSLWIGTFVLIMGIFSGVLGILYALGQHQLKRFLAYSSIENIGIILMGLGIGILGLRLHHPGMALLGFSGCLLHVLNHALFKSLLFMGAGIVLKETHQQNIDRLGGLFKSLRITGVTFLVGSLAIVGLPLFNGFISEFLIYFGAFQGLIQRKFLYFIFLISILALTLIGGLALACFTKVFGVVFLGEERTPLYGKKIKAVVIEEDPRLHGDDSCKNNGLHEPSFWMLSPLIILAGSCFVVGFFPYLFVQKVMEISQYLVYLNFSRPIYFDTIFYIMRSVNTMLFVLVVIFFFVYFLRKILLRKKQVRYEETWGCGFSKPNPKMQYTGSSFVLGLLGFFKFVIPMDVYKKSVQGFFPASAGFHSEVRDIGEHGVRSGMNKFVFFVLDRFRWIQQGSIHLYIAYIFLAIIISILLFLVL